MLKGLIFITTVISILYIIACINKNGTELNELWRSICYIMFKTSAGVFFDIFVEKKTGSLVYVIYTLIIPVLSLIPLIYIIMFTSLGYVVIITPIYALWLELHVFGLLMIIHVIFSIWYLLAQFDINKKVYLVLKICLLGCLVSYFILYILSLTV